MADATAHTYEPSQGHGLRHDPFNAIVSPRPIGWVSTLSAAGVANLAPYSFFNGFNYTPPIIGFSSIGWKDTVANAQETGVFCWNLATRPLAESMNLTCAPAPPEVDEFEVAGLTKAASLKIAAPRVAESPVNFECRVSQIVQLQTAGGAQINTWVVFGEVVCVHIDKRLIVDGVYDVAAGRPIVRAGRMGDYFEITRDTMFDMVRPNWPIG
jgi:flavin reductase (DIM6/NTAB) family NADH-FMN oxidoreductase RutF